MNYSRQREALLSLMRSGKLDHPTADMVYVEIRKNYPNISLGTVYRNLNLLAQNNSLLKIKTAADADRFDHNVHKHLHIICEKCGAICDIDSATVNLDVASIERQSGFKIDADNFVIKGLCKDCRK